MCSLSVACSERCSQVVRMTWPPPVDSSEARERREAEQELEASERHDPRCRAGWLGEDLNGRLVPCLMCRPHLVRLSDGRIVHRASADRIHREEQQP
jgi:hypothetical protein